MSAVPDAADRRAMKAATHAPESDAADEEAARSGSGASDSGREAKDFQAVLLQDAIREARKQREAAAESRGQRQEEARRLALAKRELAVQKKKEERARKRIRSKCASIPTSELMLELEYRTELKAKVMERLAAAEADRATDRASQ